MKKVIGFSIMLLLLLPAVAGCAGRNKEIPVTTDLGKMLSSVPVSVLKDHQVWFQDPGLAKQQAGFGQVTSYAALQALSQTDQKAFGKAVAGALVSDIRPMMLAQSAGNLYGWDVFSTSSSVFVDEPPPYQFTISTGTFDVPLIKQKFTSENYTTTSRDGVTYLTRGPDYQIVLTSEFSKDAISSFDRLMVTHTTIITAPATSIMNAILDARAGKAASLASEPAARALADQLGDTYAAFLNTPSGLTSYFNKEQPLPQFHLPAAANWTPLHDYALAGIGYRKDGQDSYLDVCVAYTSYADAEADAPRLAARLKSYVFRTDVPTPSSLGSKTWLPLTEGFNLSAPEVNRYDGAATVTFHLRYLPNAPGIVSLTWLDSFDDMLFLMPDPTPYLAP